MAARIKREKIKLESIDTLLGAPVFKEGIEEISIEQILPFKNHPFKVVEDQKMKELVESIKTNGVLSPVLLRKNQNNEYEMISGHRRLHAAKLAGLETVPAIVKAMSDDEAVITMVDSNFQREEILPSERAFAYKMKMDALKHQGKTSDQRNSADIIGEDSGMTSRQVQRYIRLTNLKPELLELIDQKKFQINLGVELSYLIMEVQEIIYHHLAENKPLSAKEVLLLKEAKDLPKNEQIKNANLILSQKKDRKKDRISFSSKQEKELYSFFPDNYNKEDIVNLLMSLANMWSKGEIEL